MEGKPLTDGKAKSLVAYHEVGHAVCGTLTPGHDAVQKVTLIPRGQARGLTWFIPGEDPTLISKQQIFARIVGALGGRAAEEIIFGDAEVTSGASSDLQQVRTAAHDELKARHLLCSFWEGVQCLMVTNHVWYQAVHAGKSATFESQFLIVSANLAKVPTVVL